MGVNKSGYTHGRQVIGFGSAGIVSLLIDLLVFHLFHSSGASPSFSNLAALGFALGFNFIINFLTFSNNTRSSNPGQAVLRYFFIAGLSALYVYVLFELFVFQHPSASNMTMTLVRVALIGSSSLARFFLYRGWVFGVSGK